MRFHRTILSILITTLSICVSICVSAQDSAVLSPQLSSAYIDNVSSKSKEVSQKLDKQSRKALAQLQKQEARIQRKLARTDSLKARQIFGNAAQSYHQLEQKLQNPGKLQQYIPSLDTIGTSLKFLQQNPQLLSAASSFSKGVPEKIKGAIGKVKGLEDRFQKAEEIKKFLNQRRQYLREQLGQLQFAKELKQLNKQLYYYGARLNEYKALLKDHKKAERKALALLSQTKLFKDFMRKNSLLASLFRLPGDPGDLLNTAGLAGLQTRVQVNNLVQQQLATGGAGAQQQFRQHIQDAQNQLNQLKNKVLQSGGSSSDAELPEGFKPNPQKTKSFLQRLELGTNLQSQKTSGYFPATSDIGLSLGYKLNDKSIIGIGASYKMGWGQNIRNIRISHQGVGLRSFVDWKIKGSFWLSGGYEMNYRSEFNRIQELRSLSAWKQSGLVGLSKMVSVKSKLLKKTKLQLLWDFLSYRQAPGTQPVVVFRIGYSF